MIFEGYAQRFQQKLAGLISARFTGLGSLAVGQVEGEGDEMSRAGLRYHLSAQGATGIAPVQALPSTAAQWFFYNPLGNPVTAFFDRLGVMLATGTAGAGAVLHAIICPPSFAPTTVPTKSTANVLNHNANPMSARSSLMIVNSGVTLVNAAVSDWFGIAQMNPAGTILGQTWLDSGWDIRGKIIVPAGCGLGLAVVSPTGTTPLFTPFASWREYAADIE